MDVSYPLMLLKNARESLIDRLDSQKVYDDHGVEGVKMFRKRIEHDIASLDFVMDILQGGIKLK